MRKITAVLICIILSVSVLFSAGNAEARSKTVHIVFTGEIHSHLDGVNQTGGLARVKTAIDRIQKGEKPASKRKTSSVADGTYQAQSVASSSWNNTNSTGANSSTDNSNMANQSGTASGGANASSSGTAGSNAKTFVLDAGGFSIGTVYQSIFASSAPELRTMGEMGYDATGMAASEFSYGETALGSMLSKASSYRKTKKTTTSTYNRKTYQTETTTTFHNTMPVVTCGNLDWKKTLSARGHQKDARMLQKAWNQYDVTDYTVIKKNGIRMAVFGLMGEQQGKKTEEQGVFWNDRISRAKEIVAEIRANEKVDLITCLSSGGVSDIKGQKGEDVDLAKEVDGIDLILSANGNHAISTPIVKNHTTIVAAKGETQQTGHLVLKKNGSFYRVRQYHLYDMNQAVKKDSGTAETVAAFRSAVNRKYMKQYGYRYDQKLVNNKEGIASTGDLVSDAMRRDTHADVALISDASLTAMKQGVVTGAVAYDTCGQGLGPDGTSGDPVVVAYLNGKDVRKLAEITQSQSAKNDLNAIHLSGLIYSYNAHRIPMNQTFDLRLARNGTKQKIDNNKQYKVALGYTEVKYLFQKRTSRFDPLRITFHEKNGNTVSAPDRLVLRNNGKEVKEWQTLASYLQHMSSKQLANTYHRNDDRAMNRTGWNPLTLFSGLNTIVLLMAIGIAVIVAVVLIVIFLIRRRRNTRRGFGRRSTFTNASAYRRPTKKRKSGTPSFGRRRSKFGRRRRRW